MVEEYILVGKGYYADLYEGKTTYKKIYNKLEKKGLDKMYNINRDLAVKIPHLVPKLIDITRRGISVIVIMEKVKGITMKKFLEEKHTPDIVKRVITSLIEAVLSFHKAGYLHGDLHEGNIIIKEDLSIILIDFDTTIEYSDEYLDDSGDLDCIRSHITRMIFSINTEEISINKLIKLTRNMRVEDVFCYETDKETATSLYEMFKKF